MQENIKSKAVKGMVWTAIERFGTQIVQFFISVIIARILMPSDYGIVGLLAFFLALAQSFLDSGFGSALIQKKDRTDVDYCTVFYFNLLASIFLYGIFWILAPSIAEFYNIPLLVDVTRVVALGLLINALTIVQINKLTIELNFKSQAYATVFAVLLSGIVGIYLAKRGYGVWALVYQTLLNAIIKGGILWCVSRWTPKLIFSVKSFKQLFSFGSKILMSSTINTVYQNIYTLVIGKVFTPSIVGYYNRGLQWADLPTQSVVQMTMKVNYPILTRYQDDDKQLLSVYSKMLRTPFYFLCPLLFGIAAVGTPLVEVVLGSKWLPCVTLLQILCYGKICQPLTHINLNLLYVKGRSDLVLKLELLKKPIGFIILFVSIPFGIEWMCIGKSVYEFFAFACNCYYTKKILDYGLWQQSKDIIPIILNSILMVIVISMAMSLFEYPLIKLIVGVLIGICSFLLVSIVIRDKSFMELKAIVLNHNG